jgi:hypothetical protein
LKIRWRNRRLGALELKISAADLAKIEAAIPANEVAGTRYDAYQMGHLDSEKISRIKIGKPCYRRASPSENARSAALMLGFLIFSV